MPANLELLDSFKLTGHLETNFACALSEDERIFVICDIGIYIIRQTLNLSSTWPSYSCQKYFLKPSNYAVGDNVDIDVNSFVHQLPKDILNESVLCAGLTPNLNCATPIIPSVLTAEWSTANLISENVGCLLGLVTNLGSMEVYMRTVSESNQTEYRMAVNLTQEIVNRRKEDFVYSTKLPAAQKMRELKKRVEYISPLTFTWSHTFKYNGTYCACIFLGHYHGDLSVWRIYHSENAVKCDFLHRYSSESLGNIASLYWHQTSDHRGALCVGDSAGRVAVLRVGDLDKTECSIDSETMFYSDTDKKIDKITVVSLETHSILIAVKQSHLLLYALDLAGHVCDFTVHNVHNYYITGLNHEKNVVQVLTFTGPFKQLLLSVHANKIQITEQEIAVKSELSGYITHGFTVSSNRVLYCMLFGPCRLQNSIKGTQFINFLLFHDANLNPLKLLKENQSGSLRTFRDCFEALRLICVKEQQFPWLGLDYNIDLDQAGLVQLKTLRLLAKISETVFSVIKRVAAYDIKPFILLHYLVDTKLVLQRLALMLKARADGKELTVFQLRSMDVQVFFLKEVVSNGILLKAQVGKGFIREISHILAIANDMVFPEAEQCNLCGEKILGPMCLPPHADSRCVFTMMPIFFAPAFQCQICQTLGHNEASIEMPICPYCDYPMDKVSVRPSIEKGIGGIEADFKDSLVYSRCASDCIKTSKDQISELLEDIEENDLAVVGVSDDEDDCDNDLKTMYFKLADLSITDVASADLLDVNGDQGKDVNR